MGNQAERAGGADPDSLPPTADGLPPEGPGALTIQQVIETHHRAVYRYAYRLTGTVADAEDLTQQAFLIAQQKLDQIRDPSKTDRWLFAVVRSCFLKSCRRRWPAAASSLDMEMETAAVEPAPTESLDVEQLDQALHALPDPQRLILAMFYFEELSYKQIAGELGVPIGTVMSRLARAKQRLRELLVVGDSSRK
jgi:RNA polymerase sigma-70 factor (ECF subfamily)